MHIGTRLARQRCLAAKPIIKGQPDAGSNFDVPDKAKPQLRVRLGVGVMAQLVDKTFDELAAASLDVPAPVTRQTCEIAKHRLAVCLTAASRSTPC